MKTRQEDLIETLESLFLYLERTGKEELTWEEYVGRVNEITNTGLTLIKQNREHNIIPYRYEES